MYYTIYKNTFRFIGKVKKNKNSIFEIRDWEF